MTQNLTSLMIVTLGFGYVLQGGAARLIFGGDPQALPARCRTRQHPLRLALVHLAGRAGARRDARPVLALLWLLLQRTRFGSVVRTVAEDPEARRAVRHQRRAASISASSSSNARRWRSGAALVAPRSPILTSMGFDEVIMTFVVVVLGGIGSDRRRAIWPASASACSPRSSARWCRRPTRRRRRSPCCWRAGGPAGGTGAQMTAIEPHRAVADAAAARCSLRGCSRFFLPRLLGGTSVAYSTLTTIAIFAVMCLRRRHVLSYLGEVSLGHTVVLGDRRLRGRRSVGELRLERLEHGGRRDRRLHRAGRRARRGDAANARVRVLAGDLCRAVVAMRGRLQLGCARRLRRHRRHSALELPFGAATSRRGQQQSCGRSLALLLRRCSSSPGFAAPASAPGALMVQMNPRSPPALGVDPRTVRLRCS